MSLNVEPDIDVLPGDNLSRKPVKKSFYSGISEDGWALWIGGLLIAVVLLISVLSRDFKFTIPVYQWSDANSFVCKGIIRQKSSTHRRYWFCFYSSFCCRNMVFGR
jgi:hypothetical protein